MIPAKLANKGVQEEKDKLDYFVGQARRKKERLLLFF